MVAMLLVVAFRPVMRLARVGEQSAVVWKLLKRIPASAIRVIVGVSTGPPNVSMVPYPTSSQTIYRIFGAPSGATGCVKGTQSGFDSLISTAILPFHCLVIVKILIFLESTITPSDLYISHFAPQVLGGNINPHFCA
jgi:hypothetical protein